MTTATIRKGNMKIAEVDRKDLIEVTPSHDGIIFVIRGNVQIYCTDQYMPSGAKEIMKNTSNSFLNASLDFDLANYTKPVVATVK
jgi:hypothetical protein